MRKRIGILLVILFVSLGLVACGKDPYEEMSMSLSKTEVNLTLIEDSVTNEIVGTPETIIVEVQAPKDISKEIVLPAYGEGYGNEFVDISMEPGEEGVYNLKITAKKQGKTEIQVKTSEGNISQIIYVNIDIAVNSISFKDDAIAAVEIGGSLDLNSVGRSFINYKPSYTSQTDVDFSLSNDMLVNQDVVKWVKLENNILSVDKETSLVGISELELVARSKYNESVGTDDVLKVKIVTPLNLSSNSIGADLYYLDSSSVYQSISIGKKSVTKDLLKYELVFASPYVDEGEVIDEEVINNSLIFGGTLNLQLGSSDYKIVYDSEKTDTVDMFATTISTLQQANAYEIQAKEVGSYVAKFRIEYTGGTSNGQFDGMFTKHIEVKIDVINLPTSKNILVNGQQYKNGNNVVAVYDYYVGVQGSEFTISSDICTNLQYQLGMLGDGLVWNSSVVGFDKMSMPVSTSVKYSNGQILYLKNGTTDTLTTTLTITVYCNIYNDLYFDDESRIDEIKALQTYKKDITVKLNLISGLESIDFDSEILKNGFELNVVDDVEGKVFYSFNEGVVAESVIRSIAYDSSKLFTYTFKDNHIILVPNDQFLEGSTVVTLTLTNGVTSGANSPKVNVIIPYEGNNVITQINVNNGGFFAFGTIKDGNKIVSASGTTTDYGEDFDSEDIANNVSERYSRETGKKTIEKDGHTYSFDAFDSIIISTWSEIEFDFYRLLVINEEIKYTNKNTLKIVSSDQSMLFWANGYLYVQGKITYNTATMLHSPLTLKLMTVDNVELHTIKVYIVNRIEDVNLSQSIFNQYIENRLESALYVDESRDKLEIRISKLKEDDRTETTIDDDIKAGAYGNIYTEYKLLDPNEVVFWFTNPNNGNRVEILKKHIVLEDPQNIGSDNGGYLKLLRAYIDPTKIDTQSYPGGDDELYAEIFGTNGINFEYAGIIKQFDQEIPVLFTVNVKNPISTQSVTTNLDKETGIYFEADDTNNKYAFNYTVYPVNASFKTIFVQMKEVTESGEADVKIAVSYTMSKGSFINYKIYESGSFDAALYYSGDYIPAEDLNDELNDCDFVIQIYGGKVTIIQKKAMPGTYIVSLARLDKLYFEDYVWDWDESDPSMIEFGPNDDRDPKIKDPMASIGFHGIGNATYNLTIADGLSESTAFQIRTTNDMLAFMQTSVTDKYYVIANDIYLNRKFTNTISGGYVYADYVKELKNNLLGRFTKYLRDTNGNIYTESYNRAIYGFTVELTNITSNMNIGLFSSIAADNYIKYVSLGNVRIDVSTEINTTATLNVGGIAGEINNENVNLIGAKVQGNINVTAKEGSEVNIGGLVGSSSGNTISINTIPDDSISVNNSDINSNVAIQFIGKNANIGGVIGYSNATEINDVRTVPSIFSKESADGNYSESNIGGIVGYAKNANINDVIVYPTLVGHSNIGGVAGLLEGGKISYAQAQMLYNVNMKTVIAGYDKVGGIVGKINANADLQETNINYAYVRSYTTKDVNNFDTNRLDVKRFHTLYTNNYYGAVVLLPSNITSASIGGFVGISDRDNDAIYTYPSGVGTVDRAYRDTLNIDYSYFMSHAVSFNNNTDLGMAGVVGRFKEADNKMVITNSYVDGALKTVYADSNGDTVSELCMNFLTSTTSREPEIIGTTGGTTSTNYSIKGDLNNSLNSYALITQENIVSNVIVSYRAIYPNVEYANSSYLYARINNSLFGIAPSMEYDDGGNLVTAFEYSGFTTTTTRTTALVANIKTGKEVSATAIALFAKKEVYENTPSGNFYKLSTIAKVDDSVTPALTTSQMVYFSENLANIFLQQQFYELNGSGNILPRYFKNSSAAASLRLESNYEDIWAVMSGFNAIAPSVTPEDSEEGYKQALDVFYENLNSKTTSEVANADNDDIVYLTRTIESEQNTIAFDDSMGATMGGKFNTFDILKKEYIDIDGDSILDDVVEKCGYIYDSSHVLTLYNGNNTTLQNESETNHRRFIMVTGAPILLGENVLDENKWDNSNDVDRYSKENIEGIFTPANGKIYGINRKDGGIYELVYVADMGVENTFTFGTSTTTYGGYIWSGEKISNWVEDADNKVYYYFESNPKLIYISTNSQEKERYKYEFDDAGIVNIHNNNYTLSYGQLVNTETEESFSEENYSYGINSKIEIDTTSTALTNSKICTLVATIDDFVDDKDIDYNDLDHLFKQYGFSNFNGEKYKTDIAYEIQGTAYYQDNYWYYDEEFNSIIKEDNIIYTDENGDYKYLEFNGMYFDEDYKWYQYTSAGRGAEIADFTGIEVIENVTDIYSHTQPVYKNPSDSKWYYDAAYTLPVSDDANIYNYYLEGSDDMVTDTIYVIFDGVSWKRSDNKAIVNVGAIFESISADVNEGGAYDGTYTLNAAGEWYKDSVKVEDSAALAKLSGNATTLTQQFRGVAKNDGKWYFYINESVTPTTEVPDYLTEEFVGTMITLQGASIEVYESDGHFYKLSDNSEITSYLLLTDNKVENGVTTATYTHVFHRRGEWFEDDAYTDPYESPSGEILPNFTKDTEYVVSGGSGEKRIYYTFKWYYDSGYNNEILGDSIGLDDLYNATEYFYKSNTYYKLTGWYYDDEATLPVTDSEELLEINEWLKENGTNYTEFSNYGTDYYKRHNWFEDVKCTKLVSNDLIVELLNKEFTGVDGAYELNKWFRDDAYSIPVSDAEAAMLGGSYISLKLNDFEFVYNGKTYDLNIVNNTVTITGYDTTYYDNAYSEMFNTVLTGTIDESSVQLMIEDNVIKFISKITPNTPDYATMQLGGVTHYVLASVTLKPKDNFTWLTTHKVNDGMPTLITPMVNIGIEYDGVDYVRTIDVGYELFYDELATFSIYAQPFEPVGNNFVASDGNENHSAHIKKDDNSVVLFYNYSNTIEDLEDVNKYKISFGERLDGYYFAQLNGMTVDLSAIEIDKQNAMQLKITSSDKGVVDVTKADNSDIFYAQVNGEGSTVITFYNLKDDSIKVSLNITVIKGFTNFSIYDDNKNIKSELETYVGSSPNYYNIGFVNNINGIEYQANQGGYYVEVISVDGKVSDFDSSIKYTSITLGNNVITENSVGQIFEFTSSNLTIQGNNCYISSGNAGVIAIKITPYVVCDGVKLSISDMAKSTYIYVYSSAQTVAFTEKDATIIADGEKEITVTVYSNKSDESLYIRINGKDIYWTNTVDGKEVVLDLSKTGSYLYSNVNSLLNIRLKSVQHIPTYTGSILMYNHTYMFVLSMNTEEYRKKTADTGINAIAESAYYEITVIPQTNTEISAKFDFEIAPLTANKLDAYLYPEVMEKTTAGMVNEYHYLVDDFTSQATIIPSTKDFKSNALFKFVVNPIYSNILALELKIDARYTSYVKFQQVVPAYQFEIKSGYNYASIKKGNVQIDNVYTLWDIPYQDGYLDGDWVGTDWIFGEYFLMMEISENMPQGITIPFEVIGYNYQRQVIINKTFDVAVEHLPSLDIKINGEKSAVYGVDEYVPLEISGRNVDKVSINTSGLKLYTKTGSKYCTRFNITFQNEGTLESELMNYLNANGVRIISQQTYSGEVVVKVEVEHEDQLSGLSAADYTIQSLSVGTDIEIDLETQYYIYTDETPLKKQITISTSQTIHGKLYNTSSSVTLQVVYVTIEGVRERNAINDVITMKTGMYLGLEAVIETNKREEISNLTFTVNGKTVADYIDDIEKQISGHTNDYENNNFWQYFNGDSYEQLSESKNYPGFSFSRHRDIDTATLFRLNAIQISNPKLRLSFSYYYYQNSDPDAVDELNGTIIIGQLPEYDEELYIYEYVFDVNIKDGSTEDAPVPIFTVEEFLNMQDGVNYILQSNLTLTKWKPMDFKSAYLDGNGFTITISSFDLSEIKGSQSSVYVGLFTTINEGSVVKNLNIDVSPLLYSDAQLSKAINETIEPNIDLRLTKELYFGTLAGRNQGTVINVKIINTDGRKSGHTLYVATTRGYFQANNQATMSAGRVAGMVALNESVIVNSFVGVNENSQIERSATTNVANVLVSQMVTVSPFALSGANNIAGFVLTNSGTITNCYVKNVNITNTTRMSSSSATGGFVVDNSGEIHSSAISSKNIVKFRASDVLITSAAITGGFAYSNSGEIQDSYTTAQIYNNNVQSAGFVYKNTGIIKNTYTTSKNTVISDNGGNTGSHSLFVGDKSDYGTLENCYYLVRDGELGSKLSGTSADKMSIFKSLDPAIPIQVNGEEVITDAHFTGFNFITVQDTYDGTWTIKSNADGNIAGVFPQLEFAENLTYYSRRELADIQSTIFKVIDKNNIDVMSAEGAVIDSISTRQAVEVVYFAFEDRIFQIVATTAKPITISKITDVTTSTEMSFETNAGLISFEYLGYNFGLSSEATYQDDIAITVKYTLTVTKDGESVGSHTIENYNFAYGINFVLVKENDTYQIYKVDNYTTSMLQAGSDQMTFKYGSKTSYEYRYSKNNPGSLYNPLVISNAEEFAKQIVTNTNEYYKDAGHTEKVYIFGLVANNGNGVNSRYVQIANDIDFSNKSIDTKYEVNNSTDKVKIGVGDVIFNGVFLGNSMSLMNINKVSYETKENYGIFNTVGLKDELRYLVAEHNNILLSEILNAVVFDLDINYSQFSNTYANKVGLLAGTITNAVVSKIDISGAESAELETTEIAGKNLVGALAGLIIGQGSSTKISEITVDNVAVRAAQNNIKNLEVGYKPTSTQYNNFIYEGEEEITTSYKELQLTGSSNTVEYNGKDYIVKDIVSIDTMSYAGGVAGVIITDSEISEGITEDVEYVPVKIKYYNNRWMDESGVIITDTSWIPAVQFDKSVFPAGYTFVWNVSANDWYYRTNLDSTLKKATSNQRQKYINNNSRLFNVNKPTEKILDPYSAYTQLREVSDFVYISDFKVSGNVNIKADFAGGVIGYAGGYYNEIRNDGDKDYKRINYLNNLQFELSNNAEINQNIMGYAYAGGIVGQAKDVYITKAIVSHNETVQGVIDANINKNTPNDVSTRNLFASSNHMTVGIGGIAGYTTDTWIVDSVSKVNVENDISLIAGGVLGRADDEAYLAYVYTTGNVYGRNMIGGLVGYYLYDNTNFNLKMNNAFAANIWSKDVKDLLKVNERAYTIYYNTGAAGFDVNNNNSVEDSEKNVWVNIADFTNDIDKDTPGTKTLLKQATGIDIDAVLAHGINTMPELGNQIAGSTRYQVAGAGTTSDTSDDKYGYAINILGTEFAVSFNQNTNFGEAQYTFVGSVLGRSTSFLSTGNSEHFADIDFIMPNENFAGGAITSILADKVELSGTEIEEEYYAYYNNNFFNVISSTYGAVRHTGSIEQGNYTSIIESDKLDLSYFKTNYDDKITLEHKNGSWYVLGTQITDATLVNKIRNIFGPPEESLSNGSYILTSAMPGFAEILRIIGFFDNLQNYNNMDIYTYKQMFGKQEYISYITGDFINKSVNNLTIGNKVYPNEFNRYYSFPYVLGEDLDEYSDVTLTAAGQTYATLSNKVIARGNIDASTVWYVDVSKYVAQYGYNISGTLNKIAGAQGLYEAFTFGETNKLYKLEATIDEKPETKELAEKNEFDLSTYMNKSEWYGPETINVHNNIYFAEESNPVTIKFKLNSGKGTDANGYRYGLFDNLVGCTFINIDFEIDITNVAHSILTNNAEQHLGLFANVINGCSFTNCSFNFIGIPTAGITISSSQNEDDVHAAKDFGMVFGLAQNSTISGTNFIFGDNLTIDYVASDDANLYQYGLAVGQMIQTTLMNVNINQKRTVGTAYAVIRNAKNEIIDGSSGTLEWYREAPVFDQGTVEWVFKDKDTGNLLTAEKIKDLKIDPKAEDADEAEANAKIYAQLPITGVKTGDSCLYVTTEERGKKTFTFNYTGLSGAVNKASSFNFGGLVGLANSSRIDSINYSATFTNINLSNLQETANGNRVNMYNVGGLVGHMQSSLTMHNVVYDSGLQIINDDKNNIAQINAGLVGQLNSTNIDTFKMSGTVINFNTKSKTLNVGVVGLGCGAGNTINNLINESAILVQSNYSADNMLDANIGAITGKEEYGSTYSNIINAGNLSVSTSKGVNNLNVGGFVGYMNRGGNFETGYNIGDITIENVIDQKDNNQNNVNVGGIVGKNNNQKAISITSVINYGDIYYQDSNNDNYFIGGLVGHNSDKELNLTSVLSLGNFIRSFDKDTDGDTKADDYLETNFFAPVYKNSKVYSRINAMTNKVSKNSKWENSYYISEHDPVASQDASSGMYYNTGNTLENFMVTAGRTYTRFIKTTKADFTADGTIAHNSSAIESQLPYVVGLETSYIKKKVADGSKYKPTTVTKLDSDTLESYDYIIIGGTPEVTVDSESLYGDDASIVNSLTIGAGQVITCADTTGSTRYYINYSNSDIPFISENRGTISNILFVLDFTDVGENDGLTINNSGNDALLMGVNYGHIMNIGVTQHNENGVKLTVEKDGRNSSLSVVRDNFGGIFTSGTSIQFTNTTSIRFAFSIGYFVGNNANVMSNCYTTSTLNAEENIAYYGGNSWYYDYDSGTKIYSNEIDDSTIEGQFKADSLKSGDSKTYSGTPYYYNAVSGKWYKDNTLTDEVTDTAIKNALNDMDDSIKRGDVSAYGAPIRFGALAINNGGYISNCIFGGNFIVNIKDNAGLTSNEKNIVGVNKLGSKGFKHKVCDSTTYFTNGTNWYSDPTYTTKITDTEVLAKLNEDVSGKVSSCYTDKSQNKNGDSLSKFFGVVDEDGKYTTKPMGAIRITSGASTDIENYFVNFSAKGSFENNSIFWTIDRNVTINKGYPYIYGGIKISHDYSKMSEVFIYTTRELDNFFTYYASKENKSKVIINIDTSKVGEVVPITNSISINSGTITGTINGADVSGEKTVTFNKGFVATNKGIITNLILEKCVMTEYFVSTNNSGASITNLTFNDVSLSETAKFVENNNGTLTINKLHHSSTGNYLNINTNSGTFKFTTGNDDIIKKYNLSITTNSGTFGNSVTYASDKYTIKDGSFKFKLNSGNIQYLSLYNSNFEAVEIAEGSNNNKEAGSAKISDITLTNGDKNVYFGINGKNGEISNISINKYKLTGNLIKENYGKIDGSIKVTNSSLADALIGVNKGVISKPGEGEERQINGTTGSGKSIFIRENSGQVSGKIEFIDVDLTHNGSDVDCHGVGMAIGLNNSYSVNEAFEVSTDADCSITVSGFNLVEGVGMAIGINKGPSSNTAPKFISKMLLKGSISVSGTGETRCVGGAVGESGMYSGGWDETYKQHLNLGSYSEIAVTISVSSNGVTTSVGGVVGLMRGTKLEASGLTVNGGQINVKGATSSNKIGGFIGYIDVKTCNISLSSETTIKVPINLGSSAKASEVGGIFGYSPSSSGITKYYTEGVTTKLTYDSTIDCSGLSQDDAVVYNDDWWTNKTEKSLYDLTGESSGYNFLSHNQWRYLGIIRGCTITVGLIYGKGEKPDNCSSTASSAISNLIVKTEGMQFRTFHAKKKDSCSPYIASKWENDECGIMETYLWDLTLSDGSGGDDSIYNHIYFTTQTNYREGSSDSDDLRPQSETFSAGFTNNITFTSSNCRWMHLDSATTSAGETTVYDNGDSKKVAVRWDGGSGGDNQGTIFSQNGHGASVIKFRPWNKEWHA